MSAGFTPKSRSRSRIRFWIWGISGLLFLAFFVLIPSISSLVMDWLWYRELQRSDVFVNLKLGPLMLGTIVGILVYAIIHGNVMFALMRMAKRSGWNLSHGCAYMAQFNW